jgi:hypothetical protein
LANAQNSGDGSRLARGKLTAVIGPLQEEADLKEVFEGRVPAGEPAIVPVLCQLEVTNVLAMFERPGVLRGNEPPAF